MITGRIILQLQVTVERGSSFSKALSATPLAQTVQYLPCWLVELLLYPIGMSCKLRVYKFVKVSSRCAHLIQGVQVNILKSTGNKQLIQRHK